MKNLLWLVALVPLLSVVIIAQRGTPTFAAHSVKVERIPSIKVDLSTKDARMFRTNLRNAAEDGVNFAGHFVLTSWGCGTNCNDAAIIDARNGKVFFPKELAGFGVGFEMWLGDDEPLDFKPGSNLLILKGYSPNELNKEHPSGGYFYYIWNGTALRQIKFVKKGDPKE
ncbi:MAG: hypothetical protein ABI999_00950 [Acidobacteriota bacterium]